MPSTSAHMGLWIFSTGDTYSTAREDTNWSIIDSMPGDYLCTAATRPTWAAGQAGMRIFETDTLLRWRWTGAAWVRSNGQGFLARSTKTAVTSTASTWVPGNASGLISVVSVVINPVPNAGGAGPRWLMVVAEIPMVQNSGGDCYLAVQRDTTVLNWWNVPATIDATASGQGRPSTFIAWDQPNTASSTYSIMTASTVTFAGTTTITGAVGQPVSITVVEL